jgi:hypothetical protein
VRRGVAASDLLVQIGEHDRDVGDPLGSRCAASVRK